MLKYIRFEGKKILNLSTGEVKEFPSISAAKRESRLLQIPHLGSGKLRVANSQHFLNQLRKGAKQ